MKEHELKSYPAEFFAIRYERKTALLHQDEDFEVGDIVALHEYDPIASEYTDRYVKADVTHVETVEFLERGGADSIDYAVLSIKLRETHE